MPIEVARFGVGHRRPDGPPGTVGVRATVIHSDGRGTVSEAAFARDARVEPFTSPNTTWMIVIEGGGWVAVAGERTRVAAGDAVLWPADVLHAAWTEHSEMRAIVVEFAGADDADVAGILAGRARLLEDAGPDETARGIGALAPRASSTATDPGSGEPA